MSATICSLIIFINMYTNALAGSLHSLIACDISFAHKSHKPFLEYFWIIVRLYLLQHTKPTGGRPQDYRKTLLIQIKKHISVLKKHFIEFEQIRICTNKHTRTVSQRMPHVCRHVANFNNNKNKNRCINACVIKKMHVGMRICLLTHYLCK